jgi:hypothetical protein
LWVVLEEKAKAVNQENASTIEKGVNQENKVLEVEGDLFG